jgi:voltage-gated potassium channel Kch
MTIPSDTSPAVEHFLIAGYRRMTAAEKLGRVVALNRALETLATARLHARYGADMPERERRLRLAALRLDAQTMTDVFGWDPRVHGL